jgi:ABC-type multidrug transport system fused ATPase/permease subunit
MLNTLFKKLTSDQDNNNDKPKQVVNGIILLYIAFILSMTTDWLDGIGVIPFIITFLFISFFISSTNQGKKWGRIVMLVLILFNLLLFTSNIIQLINNSEKEKFTTLAMVLYAVEVVVEIIATVFLFSKPANAWFNGKRTEITE